MHGYADNPSHCDGLCNYCQLIGTDNNRLLTVVLNILYKRFGNDVYLIVQKHCPNLTVCKECRIDDFVHVEGCSLMGSIDESTDRQKEMLSDGD